MCKIDIHLIIFNTIIVVMRFNLKKYFITCCILFFGHNLYSVDLETYFIMNNFHFNSNNEILSSDYNFEYGEIVIQEIGDGLYLDAGITKSIISDYSIYTDFRLTNDLFGFNLGIFTNFINKSSKILTPGLNYGLDFIIPGLLLVKLKLNNTIPNTSPLEKGVDISNYTIKIGFYAGDTIISGNLLSENNTKGTILTSTSTTNNKYFLNLDLFSKYSMYRISIDMGWNFLSRTITSLATEGEGESLILTGNTLNRIEAGSAYFNTDFTILISDNLTIDIGILLHLYKMPLNEIKTIKTNEFSWGMNLRLLLRL